MNEDLMLENNLMFKNKMTAAVAEITAVAGQLPGVVIIHDLKGKVVWMSDRGLKALDICLEDVIKLAPEEMSA